MIPYVSTSRAHLIAVTTLALIAAGAASAWAAQRVPDYELPAIKYMQSTPNDAVAQLQRRIDAGELSFEENGRELLLAVLQALDVPVESQLLVFSRTSLQKELISPSTPRALYFSDEVYVGWVPGGLIEVAAIDPVLGPIFYHFPAETVPGVRRNFVRDASCLLCHGYFFIRDIPSLMTLSGMPDKDGNLLPRSDFNLVDDATPFEKRWGGWYVTGYSGETNHLGNAFGTGEGKEVNMPPNEKRPAELSEFFETSRYPAATSDMANLLIMEHQLSIHNEITKASQNMRLGRRASEFMIVDHLLFSRAAPLPEGIAANEAFIEAFAADAPRSQAGDSLKDLQLDGRLFRNRCSFLIYSDSFAALPASLKSRIYTVLFDALHNDDPTNRYAHLEPDEKTRIYQILMETHPEARQHFEELAAKKSS